MDENPSSDTIKLAHHLRMPGKILVTKKNHPAL